MILPTELQTLIADMLKAVRQHPQHEMGIALRKQLYDQLKTSDTGQQALVWLDILAARYVLPIYEQDLPDAVKRYDWTPEQIEEAQNSGDPYEIEVYTYPIHQRSRRMLEVAEGTLTGTFPSQLTLELVNNYYHTSCNIFGLDDPYIPDHVVWAWDAARKAVHRSIGLDPVDKINFIALAGFVSSNGIFEENYIICNNISDFELAHSFHGDGAAAAMAAFASNPDDRMKPDKTLEFWEWWLTDGIEQAWEKAAHQPE